MKKKISLIVSLICIITMAIHAQSYSQLWKEVEEASKKSLPQTVTGLTERIYQKAKAEKNVGEMLKAYTMGAQYRNQIDPDSFYVYVSELEKWASSTNDQREAAILHSLIASTYGTYAANNQWNLRMRTDVTDEPSADLREWSGNQFVQKVLEHSFVSLKDSVSLLNTLSTDYVPFVEKGAASDYYMHDLYHLLSLRAVNALNDVLMLQKDFNVRDAIDTILNRMVTAYNSRGNKDAWMLSRMEQLMWQKNNMSVEQYLSTWDELIQANPGSPLTVEIYFQKANYLSQISRKPEALRVIDEAISRYPGYERINLLKQLQEEIFSPYLSMYTTSTGYTGENVEITVSHKNMDGFTLKFFRVNLPISSPELENEVNEAFYKKHTTLLSTQHYELNRPANYELRDTIYNISLPEKGLYLVQIIPDTKPVRNLEQFVSVTDLKLISRRLPENRFEAIVLDAKTGMPVSDANVRVYGYSKGDKVEMTSQKTNGEGKINLEWNSDYVLIVAHKGDDTYMNAQNIRGGYFGFDTNSEEREQMTLLTDRSIYRPGQTVYVKGIVYDHREDTANVISNKKYTLTLVDANRREIGKKEMTTNDFGSFTTEFILPSGGLNGTYYLRTESTILPIRVEEYKRPTFDITFDKPEGTYRLGDSVNVKGQVKTFSGVVVQDVPVQYTIKRSSRSWWGLIMNMPVTIASGTLTLNESGQFTIPVTLEEDKSTGRENGFFIYTVEATVTNIAGETQSSTTTLVAGIRSLLLEVVMKDEVNKEDSIKVTFHAKNLSDIPLNVDGEYKIYPFTDYENGIVSNSLVLTGSFTSNKELDLVQLRELPSGAYRMIATAKDEQGREAKTEKDFVLFSINDTRLPIEIPIWFYLVNDQFDYGHPASFVFGTSLKDTYILMDVFNGDKRIESRVIQLTDSLVHFEYPYKEEYGTGLTVTFAFVKDGKLYQQNLNIQKRLTKKQLEMKWEVFRDKLIPGQREEWRLVIKTPQGTPAESEMLAMMYDASLDKLSPLNQALKLYYNTIFPYVSWTEGYPVNNYYNFGFSSKQYNIKEVMFDRFWNDVNRDNIFTMYYAGGYNDAMPVIGRAISSNIKFKQNRSVADGLYVEESLDEVAMTGRGIIARQTDQSLDNSQEQLRTNFAETAFFYPQLRTNENGEIIISFTIPESLTRWNFRGYAHTKGMLTGMLEGETVTSKDFMLTPNLPRFVRVGDQTSFAASVTNVTGKAVSGTVTMTLFDPVTNKTISTQKQKIKIDEGKSEAFSFMFTATDKYDVLGCKIVAEAGKFSDGEQHLLPVLSNKEYITETVPMPIRGNQTREFSLEDLFNNNSTTATDRKLTIEFAGNPAWYAIQALPSVSLPTNDNAISWVSAYYANSLAAYILKLHPQIKSMFDTWKAQGGTKETFMSNLQKNEDVKNIILEESPWVMEANTEAEQMQRIATLFDVNNVANNNLTAINKLRDLQLNNGSWPWYKGMSGSRYITTYVVEVLSRLNMLTGENPDIDIQNMMNLAFQFLHNEALTEYNLIMEGKIIPSTGISGAALDYLYVIALSKQQVDGKYKPAYNYFLGKVGESISKMSVTEKAHAAVILKQNGKSKEAEAFMASLKEYLVQTDELGMYFAFNESPYTWSGLRIPAHVAVMEAFNLVANDQQVVEEMKIWLLKQKQTQQWDSPVSSVDAIYALLNSGSDLISNRGDVRITLGSKVMETLSSGSNPIPGIRYIKETITDTHIIDRTKNITVSKRDDGIAWGAVYAQYMEDIDKVTQRGGELNIEKKLYIEKVSGTNTQLIPVESGTILQVGDKVVSRITIRLDRAMDFVQLKDQRGACFEPVQTLSGYTWNNGIGYYIAVKDASTNFFFDSLSKGVYVLEYGYRVSREGTYDGGLATIQSAYAPEYASHSGSTKVQVGE